MATGELPDGFDRAEVSVILRRAIDLADDRESTTGESLSAADLAAVADEVGIPRAALATALAESRAGLAPQRSLVDRLIGPAKVGATNHLPTDEATAAANLQRWLEVEHGLTAYVRQDGVVIASRRGGLASAIGAGVRRIRGTHGLNRARSVQAVATAIDDGGTVCVVADVSNRRTEALVGGSAVAGSSVVAIGVVAVVAGPLVLAAVPVAVAAGIGTARLTHRRTVDQVAEQVAFTTEAAGQEAEPAHPALRLLQSGIERRSRRRRSDR